jgi:hypothetical protein
VSLANAETTVFVSVWELEPSSIHSRRVEPEADPWDKHDSTKEEEEEEPISLLATLTGFLESNLNWTTIFQTKNSRFNGPYRLGFEH